MQYIIYENKSIILNLAVQLFRNNFDRDIHNYF